MHASRFFEWLGRIRRQDVTYFTTINNLGYLWINDTLSGLKTVPLVVVSFEFVSLRSSPLSSDFPLYQLVLLNVKTETPSRFIQLIFHSMDFMQIFFSPFHPLLLFRTRALWQKDFPPKNRRQKGARVPSKGGGKNIDEWKLQNDLWFFFSFFNLLLPWRR